MKMEQAISGTSAATYKVMEPHCSLLPNLTDFLYKITFVLSFKGYNFGFINLFLQRLVAVLKFG